MSPAQRFFSPASLQPNATARPDPRVICPPVDVETVTQPLVPHVGCQWPRTRPHGHTASSPASCQSTRSGCAPNVLVLTSIGLRFRSGFHMHEMGRQSGLLVPCKPVWFVVPLGATGRLLMESASHGGSFIRPRPTIRPGPWGRGGEGDPCPPPHAVCLEDPPTLTCRITSHMHNAHSLASAHEQETQARRISQAVAACRAGRAFSPASILKAVECTHATPCRALET